jgi:hypothetical protein
MHTNQFLASKIGASVRFEDLLRDYGLFEKSILQPTGLRISEELWRREVERPRNTSRAFRMRSRLVGLLRGRKRIPDLRPLPRWQEWDDEMSGQFWEICGQTMRRFGYLE